MGENGAKFVLSIRDGVLEVSGSEDFVARMIEKHAGLLKPAGGPPAPPKKQGGQESATTLDPSSQQEALETLDKVFAVHKDELKVICDINGRGNAEKMRKASLLLLLGHRLRGLEDVPLESLRQVCRDHGCFDANNFASAIKAMKGQVTQGGGRAGTAKLTRPGFNDAMALAKEVQGA